MLDDCGECAGITSCATCTSPNACNAMTMPPSDPSTCIFPTPTCDCDPVTGGIQNDTDGDGICDDQDPCVGVEDECGVCDGPGATLECGCTDIPEEIVIAMATKKTLWVCAAEPAQKTDADGICDDVDNCTDTTACNYNDPANEACAAVDCDGVCGGDAVEDAIGVCNGDCAADADADVSDDVDDCVGTLDAGICDGPGAIYECGCSDIPEGDCDCNGNQLDVVGMRWSLHRRCRCGWHL